MEIGRDRVEIASDTGEIIADAGETVAVSEEFVTVAGEIVSVILLIRIGSFTLGAIGRSATMCAAIVRA